MTDLDIIRQIEKERAVWLEKLDEIVWNRKGYTVNQNGQVTGLGLSRCGIGNLDRIIFLLKESNLRESGTQAS